MIEIGKLELKIKRAGKNFLDNIFEPYRKVSYFDGKLNLLSGKDALKIFNTLGVTEDYILLMASANGLDGIHETDFQKLLDEQIEESKNTIQC